MAYPYLSDIFNAWFGTEWHIPIAMFGTFVALAIVVASYILRLEFSRFEKIGLLPRSICAPDGSKAPHELVSDLVVTCAIWGLIGARLFHILDYPSEFLSDPLGMILMRSGFSIYGGLILGVFAGISFLKKRSVPITTSLDAAAPAMILGYGIGRLGCQISGDGDWGIASNMSLKPTWLPDWLWAQTYQNNILGVSIPEPGVYPTPIYEFGVALLIFLVLWSVRVRIRNPGALFSLYLILSGFERLLIEKIRINKELIVFEFSFTQAEIISILLIIAGLAGVLTTSSSKLIAKLGLSFVVVGALTACASI